MMRSVSRSVSRAPCRAALLSAAAVAIVGVGPASAQAAETLVAESLVNVDQVGQQRRPYVSVRSDDSYVIVWQSAGADWDVRARLFAANGSALGGEILVSEPSDVSVQRGDQVHPGVCGFDDRSFVVVWESAGSSVATDGIYVRRFNSAGTALGAAVLVSELGDLTINSNLGVFPQVACGGDGRFVLTWGANPAGFPPGGDPGNSPGDVYLRRYDAGGTAIDASGPVRVTSSALNEYGATVALGPASEIVIPFSREVSGSDTDIYAVTVPWSWDPGLSGLPTPVVLANSAEQQRLIGFDIDPAGVGAVVLTWHASSTGSSHVEGLSFSDIQFSNPTPLPSVVLSPAGLNLTVSPDISIHGGKAIQTFNWRPALGSAGRDVFAATTDDPGGIYPVNEYTTDDQYVPVGAVQSDGTYLLVWTSAGQDADVAGEDNVYQRRWKGEFGATCADADGDGYGDPGDASCSAGPQTDCDDSDPAVNPGAAEIPANGIDDDCNPDTPTGCTPDVASAATAPHAAGLTLPVELLAALPFAVLWTRLRSRRRRVGDRRLGIA